MDINFSSKNKQFWGGIGPFWSGWEGSWHLKTLIILYDGSWSPQNGHIKPLENMQVSSALFPRVHWSLDIGHHIGHRPETVLIGWQYSDSGAMQSWEWVECIKIMLSTWMWGLFVGPIYIDFVLYFRKETLECAQTWFVQVCSVQWEAKIKFKQLFFVL